MNIRAEYLVGKQKPNEWAGVYGYRPENETDSNKAEMFVVIRIETDSEEKGLERIAKMLLDELQQSYFSDKDSPDEILRIENSFNKMKAKLEVILSREEEILEKGLDLEIGAAFLLDEVMYVGVVGESKVYIYRNNKFVDISGAIVDANLSGFIKTGSLKVSSSDAFCLATSNVSDDKAVLEKSVQNLNIRMMDPLKEREGAAVLMFADQSLEWDKGAVPVVMPKVENFVPAEETMDSEIPEYIGKPELLVQNLNLQENMNPDEFINALPDEEPITEQDYVPPIDALNASDNQDELDTEMLNKSPEFNDEIADEFEPSAPPAFKDRLGSLFSKAGGAFSKVTPMVGKVAGNVKGKASGLTNKVKTVQTSTIPDPAMIEDDPTEKTYMKVIKDIFRMILNFINGIINFFKREVLGQGGDRSNRVQYQSKVQRNRKILVVILIIAVIFIYLSIRDSQDKRAQAERLDAAKSQLADLQNQFSQLNSQVETVKLQDQSKKDLLLSRIDDISSKAKADESSGLLVNDLESLIKQASLAKDNVQLIKEVNAANVQIISDIGKVHSDSDLRDIVFSNGSIFVSDNKRGVIYKIAPNVNSDPVELVKGLTNPTSLVKNSAGDVIFYDSDSSTSIGKINQATGEVTRFPFLSTAIIGNVTKAAIYTGSDNLYEIHQDHQQIFKREASSDGYAGGGAIYTDSNPPNWKTDPEFAKAIDIAVPYEIYVLIQGGGMRRYLAGDDNTLTYETFTNFSKTDYDKLNGATAFDIDGTLLAIADPPNKRVLVFEIQDNDQKNLKFVNQFVYRGSENTFGNIKELAISQSNNEIFVLDGTQVIKLGL